MKRKQIIRARNSIDISSPIVARKHKARNKTNTRNSNRRDTNSISALLSEITTIYRESPSLIRLLLRTTLLAIPIIMAEESIQLAFSPHLLHYPTLPFAASALPILVLILKLFFRENKGAARFTSSIFLFFMTNILRSPLHIFTHPPKRISSLHFLIFLHHTSSHVTRHPFATSSTQRTGYE